jgi:hypothetical protein
MSLVPLLSLLSLLPLALMRLVRCLLGELDAAGHTYALESPLLLTSDVIAADVELDQRLHIGDSIGNSKNSFLLRPFRYALLDFTTICVLVELTT